MERILHLTLKKRWFDMILSGEKKEEYREVKYYWLSRLKYYCNHADMMHEFNYNYTHIMFKNGYSKCSPSLLIELISVRFGKAKHEWSDGCEDEVLVIELGKIIETKNI